MFKRVYKAEIVIRSSPDKIWGILADFDEYAEWNVFTPVASVEGAIGGRVRLEVFLRNDSRPIIHHARVSRWEKGKAMAWKMNRRPFIWAERVQELEQVPEGTIYRTLDFNYGPLVPLVNRIYGKSIVAGFERLADALKKKVENQ